MFEGEGCQMCISHQVGYGLAFGQHLLKYSPMPFSRSNESCTGLVQPALYPSEGLFKGERMIEDPGIGPYANKGGQNCPA